MSERSKSTVESQKNGEKYERQTRSKGKCDDTRQADIENSQGFEEKFKKMYNEFSPALKKSANAFNFMRNVTTDSSEGSTCSNSVKQSQAQELSKFKGKAKKKLSYTTKDGKKKKEPAGYCTACSKTLSRRSDEGRHWLMSCKANPLRKNLVRKSKGR